MSNRRGTDTERGTPPDVLEHVTQADLRNAQAAQQFGEEQVDLIIRSIRAGATVERGPLRVVVQRGRTTIDGTDAAVLLEQSTRSCAAILNALEICRELNPGLAHADRRARDRQAAREVRAATRVLTRNTLAVREANLDVSIPPGQRMTVIRSLMDWLLIREAGLVLWTASVALQIGLRSVACRFAALGLDDARRVLPKAS